MEKHIEKPETLDQEYVEIVERAAKEELDLDIPNSTLDHATFLTRLLLNKASKTVRILTGSLSEALYDDRIKEIFTSMLKRGVDVKLIIWHKTEPNTFLDSIGSDLQSKIKVKRAELEYEDANYVKHFLVVDNRSYRLEEKHGPQENQLANFTVKGIVNFNNTKVAETLLSVFDDVWSRLPNLPA